MNIQAYILQFFEAHRNPFLTLLFTSITILAEEGFLVVVLSILYWCVDKTKGKRLAWFVLFGLLGNSVIKNIVQMPRPYELGVVSPLRMQTALGYSFPSGHTQSATSFWGGSMMIFKTRVSVIIGCIMIVLTALSRMYLGVHWPMDVLGGIVFGFIFIYFASKLIDETGSVLKYHVFYASLLCLIALVFNVRHNFYSSVSTIFGFCLGTYLEQNYIMFNTAISIKKIIYRLIIGFLGVFAIYLGIEKYLPDVKSISMLKNALVMLWITVGAPYLFKKVA